MILSAAVKYSRLRGGTDLAKGKSGKKRSFAEILTGEYDVPAEMLSGGCFVEIRGRHRVSVRGCRRVVLYSPVKVVLKMKKEMLQICGKRLSCSTYFAGAMAIEGIIDSVSFLRELEEVEG